MTEISTSSRQPFREAWTTDRLDSELAINLGLAIDQSTHESYTSALNSYITFCRLHSFDIQPTPRTLAYYVTFQSSFINPNSVDTYLSGICNQLESHFPDVRQNRKSALVCRALKGAKRRFGRSTTRKLPLTLHNLDTVYASLGDHPSHDDLLFASQLFTGFENLLCLGELCWPDNIVLRDYRKVTMRHTVQFSENHLSLFLPAHKGDAFFEGNKLIIRRSSKTAFELFTRYLHSRDQRARARPELWLRSDGTVPTRSWFIARLRRFFPNSIGGQSMRAGGATALAEAGVAPALIQAAGRWSSDAFNRYIRKNVFLFEALLIGRPTSLRVSRFNNDVF